MPVQAGLINPQIPMAAHGVNVSDAVSKGFKMRDDEAKRGFELKKMAREEQTFNAEENDRNALTSFLDSGGDLATPEGMDKALPLLKGKVSANTYLKLADRSKELKTADVKLRSDLAALDSNQLALRGQQLEKTITYLAEPLQVYEASKATKGEQEAMVEFDGVRNQVLTAAAQEMGPNGQPMYPPEVIEQLKNASPTHLKAMLSTTKYQQTLLENRLKESQIERNKGLAAFDEARAKVYLESGGPANKSQIAKIIGDVNSGLITQEQGDQMIQGIIAKTARPADVTILTPEALEAAATDFYLTSKLPARLGARERALIMNRAAEVAKENGDTAAATVARQQANKANQMALNKITQQEKMVETFKRDADKRLVLVLELAKKADQNGVPAVNRWINAGRVQIAGDTDVTNLNSAMIAAQTELAKIMSGAFGNTPLSDSARREAAEIINKYMSFDQLDSLIPNIRREMQFKQESFKETRRQIERELQTPNVQRAHDESQRVTPAEQAERDKGRKATILQEYRDIEAKIAKMDPNSANDADALNRAKGDRDALARELNTLGVKDVAAELRASGGSGAMKLDDYIKAKRAQQGAR